MSKATLVIDMPSSCDVCDFVDVGEAGKMWCGIPWCGWDVTDYVGCRAESCPLCELPQKMQVCGKYPQADGITPSYKIGWNACIDKILERES